jgi:hypothetical protein
VPDVALDRVRDEPFAHPDPTGADVLLPLVHQLVEEIVEQRIVGVEDVPAEIPGEAGVVPRGPGEPAGCRRRIYD